MKCPTPYKKSYSKKEAREKRNYSRKKGRLLRIYKCECNKWHLTHKL